MNKYKTLADKIIELSEEIVRVEEFIYKVLKLAEEHNEEGLTLLNNIYELEHSIAAKDRVIKEKDKEIYKLKEETCKMNKILQEQTEKHSRMYSSIIIKLIEKELLTAEEINEFTKS